MITAKLYLQTTLVPGVSTSYYECLVNYSNNYISRMYDLNIDTDASDWESDNTIKVSVQSLDDAVADKVICKRLSITHFKNYLV